MDDDLPDLATLLKRPAKKLTAPPPPPPPVARGRRTTAPAPLWKRETEPNVVDGLIKSVSPAVVIAPDASEPEEGDSDPEDSDASETGSDSDGDADSVATPLPKKPRARKSTAPPIVFGLPADLQTHPPDLRTWTRLGLSGATLHVVPHATFSTLTDTIKQPSSVEEAARYRETVWAGEPELIVVSMDPAIKHFAIRVERRSRDGTRARLLYFDVLDLDPGSKERSTDESIPKTKRRKTGKSLETGELRTYGLLTALFHSFPLRGYLSLAHVILVEHQHDWKNPLASRISGHALGLCSGLLATQVRFTAPMLVEMHSKAKDDAILVTPKTARRFLPSLPLTWSHSIRASSIKKLSRSCRKTASIETAVQLALEWGDEESHALLTKRGETKRDDLADCVCHIESFRRWIGWGPVRTLVDAPKTR